MVCRLLRLAGLWIVLGRMVREANVYFLHWLGETHSKIICYLISLNPVSFVCCSEVE